MGNCNIYNAILSSVMTEKSSNLMEVNKYTFKVRRDATKAMVTQSVEKLLNAKVVNVRIINMTGKRKHFRGMIGKLSDYKKAIVTLAKGEKLDIEFGE